ncbi:META domain-containing protein [Nakamurella sp. YIM 132087]|uniref:META domain-containing protein n=1 Tax=Nakamurella alba TaxID=2665158 RepID=A0A7K1FLF4_9ACTN|nr:META domain-containing protein [Nakamurella alba]MTD14219.1 META domain-containing protein [Nakamurella alba]
MSRGPSTPTTLSRRSAGGLAALVAAGLLVAGCAQAAPAGSAGTSDAPTSAAAGSGTASDLPTSAPDSPVPSSPGGPASGSAGDAPTQPGGGGAAGISLPLTTWVVTDSADVKGHDLVEGSSITLSITDSTQLGVRAGCNSMGGTLAEADGVWTVSELSQTEMACEQPLMDQDSWVAEFLQAGPKAEYGDGSLVLTGTDGSSITFGMQQPASLTGTNWVLDGILDGDVASSIPADVNAWLRVDGTQLSVNGGCNGGGSTVAVTEGTPDTPGSMEIEGIVSTMMACDEDIMTVEQTMFGALDGTVSYLLTDQSLVITAADGTGLMFRAAPAVSGGAATEGQPGDKIEPGSESAAPTPDVQIPSQPAGDK